MMNFMQALIFLLRNFLSPAFCRPEARLQKLLHERLSRNTQSPLSPQVEYANARIGMYDAYGAVWD